MFDRYGRCVVNGRGTQSRTQISTSDRTHVLESCSTSVRVINLTNLKPREARVGHEKGLIHNKRWLISPGPVTLRHSDLPDLRALTFTDGSLGSS